MGPSLGFVTDVFVLSCVTYYVLFYCIIGFVLHHCRSLIHRWSCIAPVFLNTIWVSSYQERLWRIWCGEFVWQWRKFKREMWRSCFRKTLCALPWNVTRDVGWTLGELSGWGWSVKLAQVSVSVDLFLQCPSQVFAESSLSPARRPGEKVVIAELGDWDMHAEHKQYIFII